MKLSFRRKKGNLEENGFSKRGSAYFRQVIEKKKLKLADWLNQKTRGYSPLQLKIGLGIFCIFFGALSFYTLYGCVRKHDFGTNVLVVNHVRSGVPMSLPKISDSLFDRARKAKRSLDSLRKNDTNRLKTILLANPYLLNNLQLIEEIYQSQKK